MDSTSALLAEAPEFSRRLAQRMEEKQLTIRDVSEALNTTYEHIRKVLKGGSFPSRWLLVELCKIFDLNFSEMQQVVAMDRVKIKYGKTVPILDTIAENWNELTPEQQRDIQILVQEYAKRNIQGQEFSKLIA